MSGTSRRQSIARMYLLVNNAAKVSIPGRLSVKSVVSDDKGIRLPSLSLKILITLSLDHKVIEGLNRSPEDIQRGPLAAMNSRYRIGHDPGVRN